MYNDGTPVRGGDRHLRREGGGLQREVGPQLVQADLADERARESLEPLAQVSFDGGDVRDAGLPSVTITNGPAVSPDGRTLYVVDTLGRTIDAYTIGVDGTLAGGRRFLDLDPALGHPDGVSSDSEGGLWVGFYGGWAARRYAPDGSLTDEVRFPVANITKIALGGDDGRTAFATTARQGLDAGALAAQPLAGDLFTFAVDAPAAPERLARS